MNLSIFAVMSIGTGKDMCFFKLIAFKEYDEFYKLFKTVVKGSFIICC